jgi:hypothetical protein
MRVDVFGKDLSADRAEFRDLLEEPVKRAVKVFAARERRDERLIAAECSAKLAEEISQFAHEEHAVRSVVPVNDRRTGLM